MAGCIIWSAIIGIILAFLIGGFYCYSQYEKADSIGSA